MTTWTVQGSIRLGLRPPSLGRLAKVNEEGQGEIAERDLEREPPGSRPGEIVISPPPGVFNLREELPRIVRDLSREELRELVRTLRAGYLGSLPIGADYGEELARLIEPTAPELAQQIRLLNTPEAVREWIVIWLTILQVIVGVMELIDDPSPQNQIVINIEHNETTINLPAPPPVPPTPPPPAPPIGEAPNG